jgi:hypothetical protein
VKAKKGSHFLFYYFSIILLSGSPIDSRVRLAVVLRFLAGGLARDLELIYRMSLSEVYSSIWRGVDAINEAIEVDDPWEDPVKLCVLEAEFRARSRTPAWIGQVGAVDGCHFKTMNPGKAVPDARAYYVARKKTFAMLATAVCDADRRFIFWALECTPTTHDSTAFNQSSLGRLIANKGLPGEYFLNGDSAYAVGQHMVVPFGKPEHTDFDFYQSSNRMAIECAFGILIRRCVFAAVFLKPTHRALSFVSVFFMHGQMGGPLAPSRGGPHAEDGTHQLLHAAA